MHQTTRGGYAGLIALIIVAAIIALIFWRSDLFINGTSATSTSPGAIQDLSPVPSASTIKSDLDAIQQAQTAKQQLESQTKLQTQGI